MVNYLLSIDGSTTKTGWSIFNIQTKDLIDHGVIKQDQDKNKGREHRRKRILCMAMALNDIIIKYKPTQIVMEDVPPG